MNITIVHNNVPTIANLPEGSTVADARERAAAPAHYEARVNGTLHADGYALPAWSTVAFEAPAPPPEPAAAFGTPSVHQVRVSPPGQRGRMITVTPGMTAGDAVREAGYDWDDWEPSTYTSALSADSPLDGVTRIILGKRIEGNA